MNLASLFARSAERYADKTAVFWGEAEHSYQELLCLSLAVASRLRNGHSVRAGDFVGLLLKNRPEFIPALFGSFETGAVVVPINHFLKPDEISHITVDAALKVLITEMAFAEFLPRLSEMHPGLEFLLIDEVTADEGQNWEPLPDSEARGESDLALLIYTSGTTGRPKGAMLSHGNLLHNVESCRQVLAAVDFDRFVLLLPMFHSFMLCVCIVLPLYVGGSIVLIKSLHPLKNVIQEIVLRQATILPAIPQFFRALADSPPAVELPLRLCVSGAAPLPGQVLKDFMARFSIPLLEGYGLSEASPVVAINPVKGPWKAGSIGVPIPNVQVSVQDDAGHLLEPGQTGEICVQGGNVMMGYWNQPEATTQALRGGWLLTGDVGYQDADGYCFITDRKKDMLLVNGINVYPREIEEVIYQYPGIREVAVIGQPDPRRGEQPVAFVATATGTGLDEKALVRFMRAKLADYKVPRRVVILPSLPRNGTGKILKTVLRQCLD